MGKSLGMVDSVGSAAKCSPKSFSVQVRHIIYSYLDRTTVLQKISMLSKIERSLLIDSKIAAKNKSYAIDISG